MRPRHSAAPASRRSSSLVVEPLFADMNQEPFLNEGEAMRLFTNKAKLNPARAFVRARIYAAIILLSIPFVLVGLTIEPCPLMSAYFWRQSYLSAFVSRDVAIWVLLFSTAALMASAFGAAFTITFGWRSDRRQVIELKRKIDQLAEAS